MHIPVEINSTLFVRVRTGDSAYTTVDDNHGNIYTRIARDAEAESLWDQVTPTHVIDMAEPDNTVTELWTTTTQQTGHLDVTVTAPYAAVLEIAWPSCVVTQFVYSMLHGA